MDDATYRKHVPEARDSYIVFDSSQIQIMLTLGGVAPSLAPPSAGDLPGEGSAPGKPLRRKARP